MTFSRKQDDVRAPIGAPAAAAAAAPDEPTCSKSPQPSFLTRHVVKVAAVATSLYIGLHVLLAKQLCTHSISSDQPAYVFGVMLCAALVLAWAAGHAVVSDQSFFALTHTMSLRLLATLAVAFGFVSMLLSLAQPRYGGVCRDAFGVDSLAVVWADIIVSAPLLGVAVALTDEGKTSLSRLDKLLLACAALIMPAVVSVFTVDSTAVEIAMMVVAALLFAPAFYAFMMLRRAAIALIADVEAATSSREWLSQLQLAQARQYLASRLLVILPVFPLTYVLAVAGVVDSEVLQVVYIIAALLYKVSFISCLTKTLPNATLYDKLISEVEWERLLNANKRSVLQFVFHEVRVPLNTLTLGISVIEGELEKAADPVVKDALQMMTGASQFMSDTLNTVLSISKVEEGAMELSFAPFVLKDLVNKVGMVLKGQLDAKNITLAITSPDATLDTVQYATGDGFRLEHVLANFLSNAIKFSPPNSTITIVVGTDKEKDEARAAAEREAEALKDDEESVNDQSSLFTGRLVKAGSKFIRTSVKRARSVVSLSKVGQSPSASKLAGSSAHGARSASRSGALSNNLSAHVLGRDRHSSPDLAAAEAPKSPRSTKSGSVAKLLPPLPAHLVGRDPKEIRWIEILVCDQGVGIPPEKQAKLFQAFSQIDAQALQQGQGSGLGLVFAQQIIELHGGKVVFRSEVGKGSVFGFCIPFRVMTAEQMMAEGNQRMFRVRGASNSSSCKPSQRICNEDAVDEEAKRVLLVDDTPSNSRMLKMLLEKRGFVCDLAEDGAVAVEMVKDNVAERGMMEEKAEASRHAYKLIFMDHQMPVMDGLEATQTLRTAFNVSAIIVGCTGNTDERDQAAFVAAGADYVLPKPVRLADVDKLVEYCRTVAFTSIPNTKLVMSTGVDSAGAPTSRLRAVPRNWKPSVSNKPSA